ncbi:hypothetical protein [Terrihabitans sp. B22-R8]|uniref:hypothetical protein n=1 Tax=Terrihabitans sp. B22-R8 TaxID=3425128 RepID=UPI00403C461C
MFDVNLARALHVLGVVLWIGGLGMATLVLLPAILKGAFGERGRQVFHAIESRFIWIARASTLIVGASGFYMVWALDAWDRFHSADAWWMHAMVGTWALFMLLLFLGEPLVLHRIIARQWDRNPRRSVMILYVVHLVMLMLSLVTVGGAVLGSHGAL